LYYRPRESPGRRRSRCHARNRRHGIRADEYANAIRDLVALDVDVASLLPPDVAAFGFDNVARDSM
jgi:hypothetical protein